MKVDVYSASSHESGTQEFCDVAKEYDTGCIHTQRFIFIYCYRHLNGWDQFKSMIKIHFGEVTIWISAVRKEKQSKDRQE